MRIPAFFLFFLLTNTVFGQKTALWIEDSKTGYYDYSEPKGMARHSDGSVYVIGEMGGTVIFDTDTVIMPLNIIVSDVFLAKYSPSGNLIWVKQIMHSDSLSANKVVDLKIDSQGNLVFTGWALNFTSVAGSTPDNGSFIAKLDADANLKWVNFEHGVALPNYTSNMRGNKIAIDASDNIFWYTDQNDEPSWQNYTGGLAVVKYDASGNKIFNKLFTQNSVYEHPQLAGISIDGDGNLIVSGHFFGQVIINNRIFYPKDNTGYFPQFQIFVAKLSPKGDLIWLIQSINGTSSLSTAHTTDLDGNTYLCAVLGEATQFGNETLTNKFGNYLIKIDKDGNTLWKYGAQNGNFYDVTLGPDSDLYVSGRYFKNFQFQSFYNQTEYEQALVLKVDKSGSLLGVVAARSEGNPNAYNVSTSQCSKTIVDPSGNVYTMGGFSVGFTLGCLTATNQGYSFFLAKLSGVFPYYPIQILGPPVICYDQRVRLTTDSIPGVKSYKWVLPTGVTSVSGSTQTQNHFIDLNISLQANNQAVFVSPDTCGNFSGRDYFINGRAAPHLPKFNTSNTMVCAGTNGIFSIADDTNVDQYTWLSPVNSNITATASRDTVGLKFANTFTQGDLMVTAKNGCGDSTALLPLKVYPTPSKPVLSGSISLCQKDVLITKSIPICTNAVTYTWLIPPFTSWDTNFRSDTTTLYLIPSSSFILGDVKVGAIGHCKDTVMSDVLSLSRVPSPGPASIIAGPDQICAEGSQPVTYQILPIPNVSQYVWTINGMFSSNGKIKNASNAIQLTPTGSGNNSIKVYGVNSCGEKGDSTKLFSASFTLPPKPILVKSNCDRILSTVSTDNSEWYFNDQLVSGTNDKDLNVLDSGIYFLRVSNYCGRVESNKVTVYPVPNATDIFFPNVITCNGDGKNDFFKIDKSLIGSSSLLILDRWGKEVYSTRDYRNDWNGENVNAGIYYYYLQNTCLSAAYKGWIDVLK